MKKLFTKEELARYIGINGFPILVASEGKVYDVTKSYHWREGRHHALHLADQCTVSEKTLPILSFRT